MFKIIEMCKVIINHPREMLQTALYQVETIWRKEMNCKIWRSIKFFQVQTKAW